MEMNNVLWLTFILPFITYILNEMKGIFYSLRNEIYRKFYKTITIYKDTTEYKWVKSYLNKNALVVDKLVISSNNTLADRYLKNEESNYALPTGKYYITYNNIIYTLSYNDNDIEISTYSLDTSWDQLSTFINHAKEEFNVFAKKSVDTIKPIAIYGFAEYELSLKKYVLPRDNESVILPKEIKSAIFDNLDSFFEKKMFIKDSG